MKINFILFLFTAVNLCVAQSLSPQVIASSGGYANALTNNISWTLGETISETFGTQNFLTRGFHQPNSILISKVPQQTQSGGIYAFPNPVRNVLTLDFQGMKKGEYKLLVYDDQGKELQRSDVEVDASVKTETLDISLYADGQYMIQVTGEDTKKLFRIIKQK